MDLLPILAIIIYCARAGEDFPWDSPYSCSLHILLLALMTNGFWYTIVVAHHHLHTLQSKLEHVLPSIPCTASVPGQ